MESEEGELKFRPYTNPKRTQNSGEKKKGELKFRPTKAQTKAQASKLAPKIRPNPGQTKKPR